MAYGNLNIGCLAPFVSFALVDFAGFFDIVVMALCDNTTTLAFAQFASTICSALAHVIGYFVELSDVIWTRCRCRIACGVMCIEIGGNEKSA
jgi:hypothetical protein